MVYSVLTLMIGELIGDLAGDPGEPLFIMDAKFRIIFKGEDMIEAGLSEDPKDEIRFFLADIIWRSPFIFQILTVAKQRGTVQNINKSSIFSSYN